MMAPRRLPKGKQDKVKDVSCQFLKDPYTQRRAEKYAQKWSAAGLDQADLKQEALLGIWDALRTFDRSKGKFWAYATWKMRARLQEYVRSKAPMVRLSSQVRKDQAKIRKSCKLDGTETRAEIQTATRLSAPRIQLALDNWGGFRTCLYEDEHGERPSVPAAGTAPDLKCEAPPPAQKQPDARRIVTQALRAGATYRQARQMASQAGARAPSLRSIHRWAPADRRSRGRPPAASPAQVRRWLTDPRAVPTAWQDGKLCVARLAELVGLHRGTLYAHLRKISRPTAQ